MELIDSSLNIFTKSQQLCPIIVCIGSPNVSGDSFGPITGQLLCDFFKVPTFVYGTVLSPVTALNLKRALDFIKIKHRGRKIIAVDSAVGQASRDKLRFFYGPLSPGKATGKSLPSLGDFSITATVNDSVTALFTTGLKDIYPLARSVAYAVNHAIRLRTQ